MFFSYPNKNRPLSSIIIKDRLQLPHQQFRNENPGPGNYQIQKDFLMDSKAVVFTKQKKLI